MVKLGFGGGHESIVGDLGKFFVKVVLVLMFHVRGEIVAWHGRVGFEDDADGIINGGPMADDL